MPTPPLRFGSWEALHATGLTWEQLHALGLTWEELLYASAPPDVRGTVVGGASRAGAPVGWALVGGGGRPPVAAAAATAGGRRR